MERQHDMRTLHHGDIVLVDLARWAPPPPGIFVLHDGMGLVAKRPDHIPPSRRGSGSSPTLPDKSLINALVRAHRWRRQIESGRTKSITDLAEHEGVTVAFVCRLLPLTCLAPEIVEAILDGRQPKGLRLAELLGNAPVVWEEQGRRPL